MIRRALAFWLVVAALALAGLVATWSSRFPAQAPLLRTDDPQLLERGRTLYTTQCASCHGVNRQGQANWRERGADGRLPAPPHDESGHTWHHPDEVLFRITRDGVAKAVGIPDYVSSMPAYGGTLSDAEIVAVLSWIKSQWPVHVRKDHDEINRQAREAQRGS
ncbi:cytochrome c [Hydrogenophaga sp. H7]|jgi:mono/diheme cytochrome c family protein|uniref:c-type cytochrome n=1 Tax=Hydrogenophaga sp. H7 TaxID=1882399 RepID=UPI0009A3CC08|nr:cytochrome c [Hydrogenophaga sp. H7]OPF63593.1 cytochrome C [Hydrogenophaga sp. H7]